MSMTNPAAETILNETDLVQTYLAPLSAGAPGAFGLLDDAALIPADAGADIVVSTDPIIAGVHFFSDDGARDIAWKALAVNVSDIVAKGASPFAYTMALAFPAAPRRDWMAAFSAGLLEAQTTFGCTLIGGDTDRTSGPLSIGVTAFGKVPRGEMVGRIGARPGDHVFVTGTIGDSALGLGLRQRPDRFAKFLTATECAHLLRRYLRPEPRLAIAAVLRRYASAALDVSDGLMKDAGRLAAGAKASLQFATAVVPLSDAARRALEQEPELITTIVAGGDDFEVLFAVPPEKCAACLTEAQSLGVAVTELGRLCPGSGVTANRADGRALPLQHAGYDHFGTPTKG